jgi:cell division septation protein DedD
MLFQTGNQTGGLRWLRMAALKGEPRAMLIYGTALFNGDGTPRDPLLGYLYVTRAAESGLEPARSTLQRLDEILPAEEREKALQLALPSADGTASPDSRQTKKSSRKPVKIATASAAPEPKKSVEKAPKVVQMPVAAATGDWRIQLGAFSKRSSAETLFGSLSAKTALKGRRAFYIPAGAVTRLQVGPFESSASAQSACAALRPQPCFPVRSD